MRSKHARSLTIDQVVVEHVYSQAEKRLRPAPVLYFKETKKGLVLSGTKQDALQALFGDDVTACFGKRVLLEQTLMRVAGRERLIAVRVWSSGSSLRRPPRRRVATGPGRGPCRRRRRRPTCRRSTTAASRTASR